MNLDLSQFIRALEVATNLKQLLWTTCPEGYYTHVAGRKVVVSVPVSDQRDGDFCWVMVYEDGHQLGKRNSGATLYTLIQVSPGFKALDEMLEELQGLGRKPL